MYLRLLTLIFLSSLMGCESCDREDDFGPEVIVPDTYSFDRNGASTVDFSGQTTRILMAEELIAAMAGFDISAEQIETMFNNPEGADPFADADLNASTKSIASKVAASQDFFASNTVEQAEIRTLLESWIPAQVLEIRPFRNELAQPGQAGQIADGTATRYVNGQGLEFNQLLGKSLIGALMLDQMLNNYLSPAVLDAGSNEVENENETTAEGKDYTVMEHKWDEAYGYLFGTAANLADPLPTLGADDSFLNKYLARVNNDPDFAGYADLVYEAFLTGRAAIVANNYSVRDDQALQIKQLMSQVIAIRAVYYLQQAKTVLETEPVAYGTVFHDLSEAYGFIYSLRFTHDIQAKASYFSRDEVDNMLATIMNDGENGLWDVKPETLQMLSEQIADKFLFTLEQAGS